VVTSAVGCPVPPTHAKRSKLYHAVLNRAEYGLATPCHAELSPPHQLSPVGRYDAIAKCSGDHALVPPVCPKDVTVAAQCPKILYAVCSEAATLDVIDVTDV
jgi:hypothetical protein